MQEIILKKISIFKTELETHLLETTKFFVENNKDLFQAKSWDCNIKTSLKAFKNILFDVEEFDYVKKSIEEKISEMFKKNMNRNIPFLIYSSWINIMGERGYQEFHNHGDAFGAGVLYLTDENSNIEFCDFVSNTRQQITPKKGDLVLFDAKTFHRVIDSDKERISLAFNFHASVE